MFVAETSFGATPTTAVPWLHFGVPTLFDPQRRPVFKPKTGLGRQYPSDLVLMKEYAELRVEAELLDKDATVGEEYEWVDDYNWIWGADAVAATINLEKHIGSLSIGAKLDLATDEYAWLKGCKLQEYVIAGRVDSPVIKRMNFLAWDYDHGTTDYVSGSATRKTFPTESYISFGDLEILYNTVSILERLQSFEIIFRRDIQRRGTNATTATKYAKFAEVGMSIKINLTLDFDSTTEYADWLADTARNIVFKIPDESGGRELNFNTCRFEEVRKPMREVDLIEKTMTAQVLGTPNITTTA